MSTVPTISVRALQLNAALPNYYEPSYGLGAVSFVYDLQAVAQICMTSLRLFTGEVWYSTTVGFPAFTQVLGTPATSQNQELYANLIVQTLLGVPYVTNVSNVVTSFTSTTRQFSFSCSVTTQFGVFYIANSQNYPTPPSAALNAG